MKTVLVLGAGSSVEFGLPAGEELARRIAHGVNFHFEAGTLARGDGRLFEALARTGPSNRGEYLRAGRLISDGLPLARSIDDFLFNHGHDRIVVQLGKAAIVAKILEAERGSPLARVLEGGSTGIHGLLAETWAYRLFSFLHTGVRLDAVDALFSDLVIINFNYDRCVEAFFLLAVQAAYGLSEAEAAKAVSRLEILHPYGQVGTLPWQSKSGPQVPFGANSFDDALAGLGETIKTFTEQAHDMDEVDLWRRHLRTAGQIIYLGFGFHKQNVELLSEELRRDGPWPPSYATAFGTSGTDREVFAARIKQIACSPTGTTAGGHVVVSADKCADFIKSYG